MARLAGVLILLTLLSGCDPDPGPFSVHEFMYDEESGVCKNSSGKAGFNEIDLDLIRATKDCECMKFTRIEVLDLKGDTIQIPRRLAYEELRGYNFKGAVLDSCELFFNNIIEADLRGADLSTLQYGYAVVTGRIDEFTKVPNEGNIEITGDSIYAVR